MWPEAEGASDILDEAVVSAASGQGKLGKKVSIKFNPWRCQ
jgi:hypothetical protein